MGAEFVRKVYALREADHPGLRNTRKSVYACIAHHCNHSTGACSLLYDTIASELGVSVSAVEKAVKWLDANGYIGRKRKVRADRTYGAYSFWLVPAAHIAGGPAANSAGNQPHILRRNNQKEEPTTSSNQTAREEEAGESLEERPAA